MADTVSSPIDDHFAVENKLFRDENGLQKPFVEAAYPHYIKYMGSKSKIMSFVLEGINEVYRGGLICDLFSGSASIAGAIGHQVAIHNNDIQKYSSIIAKSYLYPSQSTVSLNAELLIDKAQLIVKKKPWPSSAACGRL